MVPVRPAIDITAAVCTRNRIRLLVDTLESLSAQTLPADRYEILVVDNASTDGTAERVEELACCVPSLRYVAEPQLGLSHARNAALKSARGRFIAYLDDDALAASDWLERILTGFHSLGPDVACLGGRVELQFGERGRPAWLSRQLASYLAFVDLGSEPCMVTGTELLVGTNFAVIRDAATGAGGFSPRLARRGEMLLSREETVMQQRLIEMGYECWYDPAVSVQHRVDPNRLTKRFFFRRAYWEGVSDAVADSIMAGSSPRLVASRAAWRVAHLLDLRVVARAFADPRAGGWPAAICRWCRDIGYLASVFGLAL